MMDRTVASSSTTSMVSPRPLGVSRATGFRSTAFCRALGVTGTVNSPTFSLVNEYRTPAGKTIYHMDWYRLKDEEEALRTGMEEYLYSGARCLVEWPDRAPGIFPPETVAVKIEALDPDTRRLSEVSPS